MADYSTPFATTGGKRLPSAEEISTGFPTGPLDKALFNGLFFRLQSEINEVIVDAGLTPTNDVDTWLRDAIRKLIVDANSSTDNGFTNNPVFPEILTTDNRLLITDNSNGTLTIDAAQEWFWRGLFKLSTDSFSLADRTFSTVANKTYHLRWNASGKGNATPAETYPNGRFELMDMDGLVETDSQYDSNFDRMLIAKVVTDSGNTATITTLVNLAKISDLMFFDGGPNFSSGDNQARLRVDFILNLARTPKLTAIPSKISVTETTVVDRDRLFDVLSQSRYGGTLYVLFDYADVIEAYVNVEA